MDENVDDKFLYIGDTEFKDTRIDTSENNIVPDKVFIVPYRDREPHKLVFTRVMPYILGDSNYRILFIHQKDRRPFNRGGIKNIGFHYVKDKWPDNYKNITLIFHDIDFMAYRKNQFNFDTIHGEVKHLYGYPHTLGGIVAIKGGDFEKTTGFPNIWTWGLEDNVLQERVIASGLKINRREMLNAKDDAYNIISLWHGWDRLINPKVGLQKIHYELDSLFTMKDIKWTEEKLEKKIWMIHVTSFEVPISSNSKDIRNARVMNSQKNMRFASWRGIEDKRNREILQRNQRLKQSRRGLLINWRKK
ncbi:MAG: galactosyltransferase-related protein [Candidatus Hodarchaeales archaeon]|jgi:hypothetical protein